MAEVKRQPGYDAINISQVRNLHRRMTSLEKSLERSKVTIRELTAIVRTHDRQLGFPGDHEAV